MLQKVYIIRKQVKSDIDPPNNDFLATRHSAIAGANGLGHDFISFLMSRDRSLLDCFGELKDLLSDHLN